MIAIHRTAFISPRLRVRAYRPDIPGDLSGSELNGIGAWDRFAESKVDDPQRERTVSGV